MKGNYMSEDTPQYPTGVVPRHPVGYISFGPGNTTLPNLIDGATVSADTIKNMKLVTNTLVRKHSHYHKSVVGLDSIDVYRVLELFNVTNPSIAHAVKKLLVAGGRGAGKDINKDIQESIDSLARWQAMRKEDEVNVG